MNEAGFKHKGQAYKLYSEAFKDTFFYTEEEKKIISAKLQNELELIKDRQIDEGQWGAAVKTIAEQAKIARLYETAPTQVEYGDIEIVFK